MKKIILLLVSLFGLGCFSQSIVVDTNKYTIDELVKDVLVQKLCVPVNSINWSTGTKFGSTNGIGYFENTNPNFPLSSGVILSTGNVMNVPGPNTTDLNDGNVAWGKDSDLEDALLKAGITMKSTNATFLEFDFVPFSPNFDFKFLFASEEYGTFQCDFSDAFAFLLTNKSTGTTTNLAVVPNSTDPISVVTIRNSLYNSSCTSVNANYFGVFNGGSNAATSATNFNGQTVLMSASSNSLIPFTTYHIKLVIADREDNQADSAIFLGANSFNVGQDVLGPDLTIANKTAICDKGSHTLVSGLDPTIYSFEWTFNGNSIGGNTPDLTVTQPGTYGLTYTIISSKCIVTIDLINVEFNKPVVTPDPVDLPLCNSSQASYTFNLSYNTPIVSVPGNQISYHASILDANSNSNPLPGSYTIDSGNLPVPIWVRIANITTGCFITKSFELKLTPAPIANQPTNLVRCETTIDSKKANFIISSQTPSILGGQDPTIYSVSYYRSIADANAGINPINIALAYTSGGETIVAKVINKIDPTCFQITSFDLIVRPRPTLDKIPDQYVCVSYTLPVLTNPGNYYSGPNRGLPMLSAGDKITSDQTIYIYYENTGTLVCFNETKFNVKIVTSLDLSVKDQIACDRYLLPKLNYDIRYFTKPGGPTISGNIELFGGSTSITTSQTVYTYFESTDINSSCQILEGQIDITINNTPKVTGGPFKDEFDCTSYSLIPMTVGNYYTFDTTTGVYTLAVSPITKTTKLYVFATNASCKSPDITFTVCIGTFNLTDKNVCTSYNLTPAPVGEYRDAPNGGGNIIPPGLITTSKTIYTYVPGAICNPDKFTITTNAPFLTEPSNETRCEGQDYLLSPQVEGGKYYTKSGGPLTAGNIELIPNVDKITTNTRVFIYKPSTTLVGCYNEKSFLITFNKRPIIDSRGDIGPECNSYKLTPLTNGKYYENPNGVGLLPDNYEVKQTKTIYIYATNPNDSSCDKESSFVVTINNVMVDPAPAQLSHCVSFTFPPLPTPDNFYYDAPGGPNGVGNIIAPNTTIYALINAPILKTYYVYHEEISRGKICHNENPFTLIVAPKPVANAVDPLTTTKCDNFGTNDGIFEFNLKETTIRNEVLKGQTPDADFTLTFYNSKDDAENTKNPIPNPSTYQNKKPLSDSVWIRVQNNTVPVSCFDVTELKLKVNLLPEPKLQANYYLCEDYKTGTLLSPVTLDTGLNTSNYTFQWTLDGKPYGGNTFWIKTTQEGTYEVKATNKSTLCPKTASGRVIKYTPYLELIYSDAFDNPTFVSVNVLGSNSGNYEYQLDNQPFQESNIFINVSPGNHIISARDKDGHCNPAPLNVAIINYPKFFTPNGDRHNETWNIPHLALIYPNAPIHIYDRYGKLLKKISPSTEGWDGIFNGQPLPSDDYWFTVEYDEKGTSKIFKSHFALKR